MSLVLLLVVWLLTMVVVGVVGMALGQAAARGDEPELQALVDRREGPVDRRTTGRPWDDAAPGRRREDVLRAELAEARQQLEAAEARLAEHQSRQASGAA